MSVRIGVGRFNHNLGDQTLTRGLFETNSPVWRLEPTPIVSIRGSSSLTVPNLAS